MANIQYEDKNTGGVDSDLLAQLTSARRTFTVVSDSADSSPITNEFEALSFVGIALGDPHPDNNQLTCVRYNATREPDNDEVFRIAYTYQSPEVIDPSGPDTGGGGEEYKQAVNLRFQQVPTKVWRVRAQGMGINPEATGDIGGKPIDHKGQVTTSTFKTIALLDVTMRIGVNVTAPYNYLTNVKEFVGKRNKGYFLGAAEGKLRYLGATSRRILDDDYRQLYEVTHSMGYDDDFHQQQFVKPGNGYDFGIQYGINANSDYYHRAYPVEWFQPFPLLISFNGLGINIG